MKPVKIGLLPLYVKLYDECLSWMRPKVEKYHADVAEKLRSYGLDVMTSPICRLEDEFRQAIKSFEEGGAEVLVTLHLAYSPSLQSEKPLKECRLPIVILDTTPDFEFRPEGSTEGIDYDHGIHGVQDMCNLLLRNGKKFSIFAGHYIESDVCRRIADCARAYASANALSGARVGIIGEPFAGMGDFRVPYDELKRDIGIDVIPYPPAKIAEYAEKVTDSRISDLKKADSERFDNDGVSDELYDEVTRVSLGVKDWYNGEKLDSFTVNFLAAGKTTGLRHMPFDRACRAMEEGVGYAGEGDVLTAALVGALLRSWDDTTFVEMFCPNWHDGYVFLSHMGEYNLRIAGKRPRMIVRPFPFADTGDPYAIMAPMRAGRAAIVNLAPLGNGKYALTAINGEMLPVSDESKFTNVVNGWFRPDCGLPAMLEKYSGRGGTHHSAMVYGADASCFAPIAEKFGWSFAAI